VSALVLCGDARAIPLPDCSVDAIVCDPPYALPGGFMGVSWDRHESPQAFQAWCQVWADEALRVLKPGGYLLAFGGARTGHRLTCAIEDAGFEVRDSIAWLYGQGYPKSYDVSKAIDATLGVEREVIGNGSAGKSSLERVRRVEQGYRAKLTNVTPETYPITAPATDEAKQWEGFGTALKPGFEPIVMARKPVVGTVAINVLAYGTGALNIDACRIQSGEPDGRSRERDDETSRERIYADDSAGFTMRPGPRGGSDAGRWPTNVVIDAATANELDAQTGILTSGANPTRRSSDKFRNAYGNFKGQAECEPARGADSGGASRFFPVFHYEAKAPTDERPVVDGVAHPTVKPLALMRWLVKLVVQPGGLVVDLFAGSGTTLEAALLEGFPVIGIESDATYLPLISYRVARAQRRLQPGISRLAKTKPAPAQASLFDDQSAEGNAA
jgi:DNA methylase